MGLTVPAPWRTNPRGQTNLGAGGDALSAAVSKIKDPHGPDQALVADVDPVWGGPQVKQPQQQLLDALQKQRPATQTAQKRSRDVQTLQQNLPAASRAPHQPMRIRHMPIEDWLSLSRYHTTAQQVACVRCQSETAGVPYLHGHTFHSL